MNGRNPYIHEPEVRLPRQAFRITFIDPHKRERVITVDPAQLPYSNYGRFGSLLGIALGNDIELDHACGGVCACATCHVIVRQGYESCNQPTDEEEDQLDDAYGLTAQSRLACQCVPTGDQDLVVEIPAWNRNLARETR